MSHNPRWPLAAALLTCTALCPPAALAQTATTDDDTAGQNSVTLQEITLTGQAPAAAIGLPLTIRATPQSVSVVTAEEIAQRGFYSVTDVLKNATGIYLNNDYARPSVRARGFSISSNNITVDGSPTLPSYQATPGTQFDDTVAYERVDILRGANGLLTGTGNPSAAVKLVRKRPTKDFQGYAMGTLGSWDYRRTEIDVSGPLNETGSVRGRFALGQSDSDHFIRGAGRKTLGIYATTEVDLTPRTTLRLGYHHDEYTLKAMVSSSSVPLWYNDGTWFNAPRSLGTSPPEWTLDQRARTAFVGLDHDFGNGWTFDGVLNLTQRDNLNRPVYKVTEGADYPARNGDVQSEDYDYTPYPLDTRQLSYDLNLKGQATLFGREHDLVFGLSGWESKRKVLGWQLESGGVPDDYFDNVSIWDMWKRGVPQGYHLTGHLESKTTTRQNGGYAAMRWNLSDQLKVITGARVTSWKTSTDRYNSLTGALTAANTGAYEVKNEITPYAGVVYDVSPHMSVYASYTDIFTPQNLYDASDNLLEPIVGKSYEVGVKGDMLDGAMTGSFALFRSEQDNIGVPDPRYSDDYLTPAGNSPYVSSGKGNRAQGFEVELSGSPSPGWDINASYTFAPLKDADGERLDSDNPDRLFRVFTTYRMTGRFEGLTLGGGVAWNSEISTKGQRPTGQFDDTGAPITREYRVVQSPVTLVNLSARYEMGPKTTLTANIDNALDEKYWSYFGSESGVYGEPRRIRVGLRHEF